MSYDYKPSERQTKAVAWVLSVCVCAFLYTTYCGGIEPVYQKKIIRFLKPNVEKKMTILYMNKCADWNKDTPYCQNLSSQIFETKEITVKTTRFGRIFDKKDENASVDNKRIKIPWDQTWSDMRMPLDPMHVIWKRRYADPRYAVLSEFGCRYLKRRDTGNYSDKCKKYNKFPGKFMHWHNAIDFLGNRHDPIYAVKDGVVKNVGYGKNAGNWLQIEHSATLRTEYMHCTNIFVRNGEKVTKGQKIATVGNTGAEGVTCHLHFVVKVLVPVNDESGKYIDDKWQAQNPREFLPWDFPEVGLKPVGFHKAIAQQYTHKEYALARMLASETDQKEKMGIVVWSAINRYWLWNLVALDKGMPMNGFDAPISMKMMLNCPRSKLESRSVWENKEFGQCPDWGEQEAGRPYHTVKEGSYKHLIYARLALRGLIQDPSAKWGGATHWFEPKVQAAMRKKKPHKYMSVNEVHRDWCKTNYFIPFLPFSRSDLRAYGEIRFLTKSGKAKLHENKKEVCPTAPKNGFLPEDLKYPEMLKHLNKKKEKSQEENTDVRKP